MKTRSMKLALVFVSVGALLAGSRASADTVFTSDGSRIVGHIEKMGGGKLVITSDILGRVELDSTKIVAIQVDQALNIEFESGDRLVGTINVSDDQSQSVVKAAIGDITVSPQQIEYVWPVGGESPEAAEAKAKAEEELAKYKPEWTATLEAGGTFKEGNTNSLEARGRFDVKRKTSKDLLHFYLAATYDEQNKVRTSNEYRGGIKYRNDINQKWFWYTRAELEFDEFEDLDLRATAAAGFGYFWLRKPDHELSNTVGVGYRHESFMDGRTENAAIVDFGLDYRVDIAPWVQFTHSAMYSPDFQDTADYRLDFDTALLFPFKDDNLKLKLGMRNEYNSRPQRGLDRLDNTYYANIVFTLP